MTKRYVVYGWDREDIKDFGEEEFYSELERDSFYISDFGTYLGTTDDEDEAFEITSMNFELSAVYDTVKRCWFN